ncbi:hypothetical protein [Ideonella oryzae]|uniref:DUF4175 domain-containing protein n=1 Tax=Ideonella oryzae TaxID=2937441 RepID=A0ABT1BQG3_9BURK|nr:hypothetical protein [Ideonella oryzae]MCO5978471.1 hypothetical protein [Ideonella oryzae]
MITLLWTVTAVGLALWSGAVWAVWALLTHDPAWVGHLREWLDASPAAGWLDHWLPGWDALLAAMVQLLQAVLRSVAAWIPWLLGAVWAGGSLLTLALAGLLHWAIRVGSRPVQAPAPGPSPTPPPASA